LHPISSRPCRAYTIRGSEPASPVAPLRSRCAA
jgi:hypothetical protein